ncbi:hypothetical protein [Sphingopyxis sp.]|uniref:hypothetical protein n=1 Tax=Sphingopyxis sp. TaxID=1908224 RepID=UPI003F6FFC57
MKLFDDLFENTDITERTDEKLLPDLSDLKKCSLEILKVIHEQCRARVSSQFSGMAVTDSRGVAFMSLFVTLSLVMISGVYALRNDASQYGSAFTFLIAGAAINILAASISAWSIFPNRIDYPGDKPSQWVGDCEYNELKNDKEEKTYLEMIRLCQIQIYRNSEICRVKAYRQKFSVTCSLLGLVIFSTLYVMTL